MNPFEAADKDQLILKVDGSDTKSAVIAAQPQGGRDERRTNCFDNKNRLAGKRTYEEICRSYENMFAFDWDIRDINNMRHPPGKSSAIMNYKINFTLCADREVTPIVLWFYINILYFPYNAHELAKVSFEEFSQPIFERLRRDELSLMHTISTSIKDSQVPNQSNKIESISN